MTVGPRINSNKWENLNIEIGPIFFQFLNSLIKWNRRDIKRPRPIWTHQNLPSDTWRAMVQAINVSLRMTNGGGTFFKYFRCKLYDIICGAPRQPIWTKKATNKGNCISRIKNVKITNKQTDLDMHVLKFRWHNFTKLQYALNISWY